MTDKFDVFKLSDDSLQKLLGHAFYYTPDLLKVTTNDSSVYVELDDDKIALRQLYVDGFLKEVPVGSGRFFLTMEGRDFILRGGYQKEFTREQELRNILDEKAVYDLNNAKHIYKTYLFTRIVAWIGAISGVVALSLSVLKLFGKQL